MFEQKEEEYLVYFFMPECEYCQEFKPILEEYIKLEDSYKIYKVNLSLYSERYSWDKHQIEGTPTLSLIKNQKEIERFVGVQKLSEMPYIN